MPDIVERASSGRAKCRGCGSKIAKGELRFGEAVANQFADGETLLWFHLACAAYRRPEKVAPMLRTSTSILTESPVPEPELENVLTIAEQGENCPRLARFCRVERAPSGRATCRACRQLIEKNTIRFALEIFEEGRFEPIGFIHWSCQADYFGCSAGIDRLRQFPGNLQAADWAELEQLLNSP